MRRVVAAVLRLSLGAELGADTLGDLEEERRRLATDARWLAEVWFWRSGLGVAGYFAVRRMSAATGRLLKRGVMDTLISDFRQVLRSVNRRPGATVALVLVLSLGVGLTSAMFALADPFLLRPLPYQDPDQLVEVKLTRAAEELVVKDTVLPTYDQWRRRKDLFVDLAAWSQFARNTFSLGEMTEELASVRVTANIFDVLGSDGSLARWSELFRTREPAVALLERGRRKTGARLDHVLTDSAGLPWRVAGVLPTTFRFPNTRWAPLLDGLLPYEPGQVMDVRRWSSSGKPSSREDVVMVGRLAPGVSASQAAAALSWRDDTGQLFQVAVESLTDVMTRGNRTLAQGSLAAGLLILLVCIGNVTNLLIARNAYRTRELATRAALGASRPALSRLAAIESLMVAGSGTILGIALASAALAAVRAVIPAEYTSLGAPEITARVWLFALVSGLLVTSLGSIPAWLARKTSAATVFSRQGAGETPKMRPVRFLVTAVQSSLAVVLAIGAALLLQSYSNLMRQDTGIDRSVLAVTVKFPNGLPNAAMQVDLDEALLELRRLSGVTHAAASIGSMVDLTGSGMGLTVNGKGAATNRKEVTPDFFETAGLSIVAGRSLGPEDRNSSGLVVNRAFVRQHWPDGVAVGKSVGFGKRAVPVVGVTDDAFDVALDSVPKPTAFVLLDNPSSALTFMIRASGNTEALREPIRRALSAANSGIAIREYSTIGQRLSHTVRDRSFATLILTFFAIAALGVSAAGVIGVVMFVVTGRTREIAIRMAIGAQRSHVRWLVTRDTLLAALTGALAGAIAGRWVSRSVESFVYGIETGSWAATIVAALAAVLLMALAALLPARRALRLDPTAALRVD